MTILELMRTLDRLPPMYHYLPLTITDSTGSLVADIVAGLRYGHDDYGNTFPVSVHLQAGWELEGK